MNDLLELLYKIREKPVLFFGGRRTLCHLQNLISGFVAGREGTNKEIDRSANWFEPCNVGFQDFVAKKYEINISRLWCDIIEFHSASEDDAFDLFFKLLDEFLENKDLF